MQKKATLILAAAALLCLTASAGLALTPYSQDFELLIQPDPAALSNDGWVIYGNVFNELGVWQYGHGPWPAPNHSLAFCQIDLDQGGPDQGFQQLSVFSDYENGDHANGWLIESNVFHEQTIEAVDIGTTWVFDFDAKLGNIEGASTAAAFIKTIDPSNNWAMTNFINVDMTDISVDWRRYTLHIDLIHPDLEGQLLQFGFLNVATYYEGSGIYYDNVDFYMNATDVGPSAVYARLGQNYPNPFNPKTRIDFETERAGHVDVSVFDLAGRQVATLHRGELPAGAHHVVWNGMTDRGAPAAAGQYRYVLATPTGSVSRSMILVK
ncbi:hypothetical protein H8E07_09260 [bacterium]|nr:hypothetical protein [bacterium]